MEPRSKFSEVQFLNLHFLLIIQASIKSDIVAATYIYRITVDQAKKLADAAPEAILLLVANLKSECLFSLRKNLAQLLDIPHGLLGAISSVHNDDTTEPANQRFERRARENF